MFKNVKEKIGQTVAKYMFFNVAVKEGTWVKALTEHEIINKYLKVKNEELETYINSLKRQWPTYEVTIMYDG